MDGAGLRVPRPDRRRASSRTCTPRSASRPTPCDITYGTNSEFGFDYLRDNMKVHGEDAGPARACTSPIIDEVDSILIDEARTPLIISGPAEEATDKYYRADRVVRRWGKDKGIEKADLDEKLATMVKGPSPDKEKVRLELENDYLFVYSEKQHSVGSQSLLRLQQIREQELINIALMESAGNMSQAARKLNISRQLLHYKMKKYNLQRSLYSSSAPQN